MQISELKIRQGNVDVTGIVTDIGETRSFSKFGRELAVANAILKDDSGSIKLTLWNDDIRRFKDGDKIRVRNGFVNEFQGEKQLTAGRFGSIELVESASDSGETEETEKVDEKLSEGEGIKENEMMEDDETNDEETNEEVF